MVYDSRGPDGAGEPLEFDTGVNAVPEAVDMCVRLMTPQEVATVRSVSKLAYDGRVDRPPVSFASITVSTVPGHWKSCGSRPGTKHS